MSIKEKFAPRFSACFSDAVLEVIYSECFILNEPIDMAHCSVFNPKTNEYDSYDLRCDYNEEGRLEIFNILYHGTSEYRVTAEQFSERVLKNSLLAPEVIEVD